MAYINKTRKKVYGTMVRCCTILTIVEQ